MLAGILTFEAPGEGAEELSQQLKPGEREQVSRTVRMQYIADFSLTSYWIVGLKEVEMVKWF